MNAPVHIWFSEASMRRCTRIYSGYRGLWINRRNSEIDELVQVKTIPFRGNCSLVGLFIA